MACANRALNNDSAKRALAMIEELEMQETIVPLSDILLGTSATNTKAGTSTSGSLRLDPRVFGHSSP